MLYFINTVSLQYYIDPVSGYIFRSMKDALRYIATGNIGRLAFKRKGKVDSDTELEDDKNSVSRFALVISCFWCMAGLIEVFYFPSPVLFWIWKSIKLPVLIIMHFMNQFMCRILEILEFYMF